MKKTLPFILLILAFAINMLCSCNKEEPEPIVVDSTTLKPVIKVAYKILDSGYVEFELLSDCDWFSWVSQWGSIYNVKKRKYWFRNGLNIIYVGAVSKYEVRADTTIFFEVKNSVPQIDSDRFIKGIVFGDSINSSYILDMQTDFQGGGVPSYTFDTPVNYIWPDTLIWYMSIADKNLVPGTDVEKLRALLKVGPAPLAKFKYGDANYPLEHGWHVFFYGAFSSNNRRVINSGQYHQDQSLGLQNKDESLEILSVKEIYQPPVFPEIAPTAFIVTFRYKATTFGIPVNSSDFVDIPGKDITDLTFDVKFSVYPINGG